MAFIPAPKRGVGTRIRLDYRYVTAEGTYTEGHEFTVVEDHGYQGMVIKDDQGRKVSNFDGLYNDPSYSIVDRGVVQR